MESIIKDRTSIMKNNRDSSTINSITTYNDNEKSIIKKDNLGNGREYVRESLNDTLKNDIKNYNYTNTESVNTQAQKNSLHTQRINKPYEKVDYMGSHQRVYSMPEQVTGSSVLLGAAATAKYVATTEKVIKESTKGIGREYIRNSLDDTVKEKLIKNNGYDTSGTVAVTETEKAMKKANAAKAFKPASEGKTYIEKIERIENKKKGLLGTTAEYACRSVINTTTNGGKDGNIGDRVAGQSIKYMIRTPRYTKNAVGLVIGAGLNIRYASKLLKDMNTGALTGKEASLLALKRGGVSLKKITKAGSGSLVRTTEDFHGSDDLGIEAIRKPKDAVVTVNRTLKITSRAVKSMSQTPQKVKRNIKRMQKAAQKTAQAAKYASMGIKATIRVLTNPIVIKSLVIAAIVVLAVIILMAGISSVAALFSSFTYSSDDENLSLTYSYITKKDVLLEKEIVDIPKTWSGIDVFHINAIPPITDPIPIISYLTVKYDDFKFEDYRPDGSNPIKDEIDRIYDELYTLNYHEWTTEEHHSSTYTDSEGNTTTDSWTVTIYHLTVDLNSITFQEYVELHKDEMFPKSDDYARYETYNNIGGTTLRNDLGYPFKGLEAVISSRYGYRLDPITGEIAFHDGIDIAMSGGTPINATMSGIATTGYDEDGYGNYIKITSGDKETLYGHCSTLLVANEATVTKGQEIATVGTTGKSTGNHLHLRYTKKGKSLNPYFYIDKEQFVN